MSEPSAGIARATVAHPGFIAEIVSACVHWVWAVRCLAHGNAPPGFCRTHQTCDDLRPTRPV